LLVFNALIDGKENIESGCFCRRKKFTIFEPGQSGETGSLTIVRRQRIPESFIDAFVQQDAHLGACKQQVFGLFESG